MTICPACGETANAALPTHTPGCGASLRSLTQAPAPASLTCAAASCGMAIPPGAAECAYCGLPAVAGLVLRFPDGEEPVRALPLTLGRDPGRSPVAARLAPYRNVSRAHAEIVLVRNAPHVCDLGSTNGTFVNEHPVQAEPVPLGPGDRLRLAADLVVVVAYG